jgi:hypothetical protein
MYRASTMRSAPVPSMTSSSWLSAAALVSEVTGMWWNGIEPGDHDQGADPGGLVVQLPRHVKGLGDPGEAALQLGQRPAGRRQAEVHPHEEPAVRALPVLLAGQDVRRLLDQEAGHRVHDPRLVRAGQREHILPPPLSTHHPCPNCCI